MPTLPILSKEFTTNPGVQEHRAGKGDGEANGSAWKKHKCISLRQWDRMIDVLFHLLWKGVVGLVNISFLLD